MYPLSRISVVPRSAPTPRDIMDLEFGGPFHPSQSGRVNSQTRYRRAHPQALQPPREIALRPCYSVWHPGGCTSRQFHPSYIMLSKTRGVSPLVPGFTALELTHFDIWNYLGRGEKQQASAVQFCTELIYHVRGLSQATTRTRWIYDWLASPMVRPSQTTVINAQSFNQQLYPDKLGPPVPHTRVC